MSKEKKLPPILPQPVRPFTIRLVNGHFVRVPKVEQMAQTDATCPPSSLRPETSPHGDGTVITRRLQLINGRFVGGAADSAPAQIPPTPAAAAAPCPASGQPQPASPGEPSPDSWAYAFGTQLDPADSPPKT